MCHLSWLSLSTFWRAPVDCGEIPDPWDGQRGEGGAEGVGKRKSKVEVMAGRVLGQRNDVETSETIPIDRCLAPSGVINNVEQGLQAKTTLEIWKGLPADAVISIQTILSRFTHHLFAVH
jgi:hypothetical protein